MKKNTAVEKNCKTSMEDLTKLIAQLRRLRQRRRYSSAAEAGWHLVDGISCPNQRKVEVKGFACWGEQEVYGVNDEEIQFLIQ